MVGAGVSGLTCGVILAEAGYEVEIMAEATGPRITSGAAAASLVPIDAETSGKGDSVGARVFRHSAAISCAHRAGFR